MREEPSALFALPRVTTPPWWLIRGDRPCWYALRALLLRTAPLRPTPGADEGPRQ